MEGIRSRLTFKPGMSLNSFFLCWAPVGFLIVDVSPSNSLDNICLLLVSTIFVSNCTSYRGNKQRNDDNNNNRRATYIFLF